MMRHKYILTPLLVVLLLTATNIMAQNQGPAFRQISPFDSAGNPRAGESLDRLTTARSLVAQGALISAAAMLEDLYAQTPQDRSVIDLLLTCYVELKAYPKAEVLLTRQLEVFPTDVLYHGRLLDVYMKMGADSLVTVHAERTLARFPGDMGIYQAVITALKGQGYQKLGMALVDRAREEFKDPRLFALLAGSFYETKREYARAVREYQTAYGLDSLTSVEADRRMAALIRYPDSPDEVIGALKNILAKSPHDLFALKFLSEAYIRQNKYAEAFESVVRLDSVQGNQGRELFNYLRRCHERKLYEQVIMVAEYIRRQNSRTVPAFNYNFFEAEAYRGLGRFPEAIAIFDRIITESPRTRDKAEAVLEIARIHHYDLKDYAGGRRLYDSAMGYGYSGVILQARLEKARLFMVEGQLDSAKLTFELLQGDKILQDSQEQIAFNLAMIELYRNNYVEADLRFRKLIADYPRGVYLNDALINSLLIRESAEMYPAVLSDYADALCFRVRLMPDSSVTRLTAVVEKGESPLVGTALYHLASLYVDLHDTTAALGVIDRADKDYPDDYFRPYCLKLKGDILSGNPVHREEAGEIYKSLLENYASYPFVGEVRERLQQMAVSETFVPNL